MDDKVKEILNKLGIKCNSLEDIEDILIPRDMLLSDEKYDEIKDMIPDLKKIFSSSKLTCLQKSANKTQKWPLLNMVRQILNYYHYKMDPIRKSEGYLVDGTKKYTRYFRIQNIAPVNSKNISPEKELKDAPIKTVLMDL